ncbi:MAG: hypothetical protein A7316_04100 [Candidatus Altiarchaeales archaeon WOR_SM1_86-2]|nr:MAG: hypothetical protein A7316_04100 [Candidatus Altiarchaeales archaeon WOR_SM1_86-2]
MNNEVIDLTSLSEDRYERQKRIIWWDQDVLGDAKVLVVGAGTLGNEICKNLALIGVGEIWVVDNDTVEMVNLNRCVLMREDDIGRGKVDAIVKHIKELNKTIKVKGLFGDVIWDLGAGFYRNFDVVILGLDNREARMYVNKYCYLVGTPLIDGAIEGLRGRVQVIDPPHTSCYECTFSEKDYELLSVKYSCPGLPIEDLTEGKVAMVATTSSIIAGIQVQEAVLLMHKKKGRQSSLAGRELRFDGNTNEIFIYEIPFREGCLGHFYLEEVIKVDSGVDSTLSELIGEIKDKTNEIGGITVTIDREIAYTGSCVKCGSKKDILKPVSLIKKGEAFCPECGEMLGFDTSGELRGDDRVLKRLGVPESHILTAYVNGKTYYVELQ